MTSENVELIRNAFEKYSNGETAAIGEVVDADLEWIFLDPSIEDPEPQVCRGREQLLYWMNRRQELRRGSTLEEIVEHGNRVLTVLRTPGLDDVRAYKTDDLDHFVLTIRNAKIVQLRACRSRAEAEALLEIEG